MLHRMLSTYHKQIDAVYIPQTNGTKINPKICFCFFSIIVFSDLCTSGAPNIYKLIVSISSSRAVSSSLESRASDKLIARNFQLTICFLFCVSAVVERTKYIQCCLCQIA